MNHVNVLKAVMVFVLLCVIANASSSVTELSFLIGNLPPEIDLAISPSNPSPGTITFEGNATYTDPEGFNGDVNLTWYLNGVSVGSGGTFSNLPSGSTVTATPIILTVNSGDIVTLCGDAFDGISTASKCVSVVVGSTITPPTSCRIELDALATCVGNNITVKIKNTKQKDFEMRVRRPDGVIEVIGTIDGKQDVVFYKADQAGSYYFWGYANDCSVEGDDVVVEYLSVFVQMPICSFYKQDGNYVPSGKDVLVIPSIAGNPIAASVKISWSQENSSFSQEFFDDTVIFRPLVYTTYNVSANVSGCYAESSFIPNVCYLKLNETRKEEEGVVEIQVGGKKYYVFLQPYEKKKECSLNECNVTADCCEGYCFEGKCVIPKEKKEITLPREVGLCSGKDAFRCYVSYIIAFMAGLSAAYMNYRDDRRRNMRLRYGVYAALTFLPLIFSYFTFPEAGIVVGALEIAGVYYIIYRSRKNRGV